MEQLSLVEALGRNDREPNASVLLLRGLLQDGEPAVRMNVLNMLMLQRFFAEAARKEILQCTNDSDAGVRGNATFALLFAFPEKASAGAAAVGSRQPVAAQGK